jgi:hypothetical protein
MTGIWIHLGTAGNSGDSPMDPDPFPIHLDLSKSNSVFPLVVNRLPDCVLLRCLSFWVRFSPPCAQEKAISFHIAWRQDDSGVVNAAIVPHFRRSHVYVGQQSCTGKPLALAFLHCLGPRADGHYQQTAG